MSRGSKLNAGCGLERQVGRFRAKAYHHLVETDPRDLLAAKNEAESLKLFCTVSRIMSGDLPQLLHAYLWHMILN